MERKAIQVVQLRGDHAPLIKLKDIIERGTT